MHQKFERIVKARRIGLAFIRDRPELGNFSPEKFGINRGLARRHPVHIAAQRVDLAIVRDHAIRMRERPSRECIGGEALMHQRNSRLQAWIAQIRKIIAKLGCEQHALINKRTCRKRDGIKPLRRRIAEIINRVRDHLAQDKQAALKRVGVGNASATADKDLTMRWLGWLDAFAETGAIHRHIAPAQETLALFNNHALNNRFAEFTAFRVTRQKHVSNGVMLGGGKGKAELGAFF